MKDIAIYGAGGFGREVAAIIKKINQQSHEWNLIGFFDDGIEVGNNTEYGQILGGLNELNNWPAPISIVIAIATPHVKQKIVSQLKNPLIDFPNIIFNTNFADKNNYQIGKGNIILEACYIAINNKIGDFNVMNGVDIFGHDDTIGSYNSFMGGMWISGCVSIGDCNYFGVGSIIIQGIKIGNGINLGAGAVLMSNPKDNSTYIGNPAKIFKY